MAHKNFRYDSVEKPLRELLEQLAEVKPKKRKKIEYTGSDIESSSVLAGDCKISEAFTKSQLDYDKERGRDSIDIFIKKVFQLGYSVGIEQKS